MPRPEPGSTPDDAQAAAIAASATRLLAKCEERARLLSAVLVAVDQSKRVQAVIAASESAEAAVRVDREFTGTAAGAGRDGGGRRDSQTRQLLGLQPSLRLQGDGSGQDILAASSARRADACPGRAHAGGRRAMRLAVELVVYRKPAEGMRQESRGVVLTGPDQRQEQLVGDRLDPRGRQRPEVQEQVVAHQVERHGEDVRSNVLQVDLAAVVGALVDDPDTREVLGVHDLIAGLCGGEAGVGQQP
jgi:hypothetical protein